MTFSSILDNEYTADERYSLDLNQNNIERAINNFKQKPVEQRKKIKLLKGHMDFGLHTHLFGELTYITLLRDPVERVISNYYFVTGDENHPLHDLYKDKSIMEVLRLPENRFNNGQTAMIAGTHFTSTIRTSETLEMAKSHIEKYFSLVGLTERFDESLILMKKEFVWELPGYAKKNVTRTRHPTTTIKEETLYSIKQYNSIDIALYDYAEKLFAEKIHWYGKQFTSDLDNFKAKLL